MSDIGETVRLEDLFDDVDAEMDYLMGLLESAPRGGRAAGVCWRAPPSRRHQTSSVRCSLP
eukprot:15433288-Alexandrium_andersonii.AAC.1